MSYEESIERLEREGIEYVVTELEPMENKYGLEDMPAHIIQYFTPQGQDAVLLCVGPNCKMVNLGGYFNHPIPVPDAF